MVKTLCFLRPAPSRNHRLIEIQSEQPENAKMIQEKRENEHTTHIESIFSSV